MEIYVETGQLNPLLPEIGRLVINFNAAEHALRRLAYVMIDPDAERTGEIAIDKLGANDLEELVRALAPYRFDTNPAIALRINTAVKKFAEVRNQRNDFVHAVWVVPNDTTDLSGMSGIRSQFRRGTYRSITPELAGQAASEASAVWEELQLLYDLAKATLRGVCSGYV